MNVEQRLITALRQADRVEPSPDLWSRVVHSIDEDRRHRRRVLTTATALVAALATLTGVAVAALRDGPRGRHVSPAVLELLEVVGLTLVAIALGPAIRRFGRNYVHDLWPARRSLGDALLRLLDLAYGLVLAGYVLLTTELEQIRRADALAEQLVRTAERFGGVLLLIGLLHAATLVALPIVALIDNSTRKGRPLPRPLVVAGVVLGVVAVFAVFLNVVAALSVVLS